MIDISRVANDSLAIPLYTLLALLALKWLDDPAKAGRAFLVGLVFAFGLLTKAYFLTTAPALALIPLVAVWRARDRLRIFLSGISAAITPLFLAGWWYLRNHRSTGTWFWQPGAELIRGVPVVRVLRRATEVDWRNVLLSVQISHIWFGDWSFLQVRGWMYRVFWDIALLACVGLAVCAFRLLRRVESYAQPRAADYLVLIGLYCLFCAGLAYHALLMFVLLECFLYGRLVFVLSDSGRSNSGDRGTRRVAPETIRAVDFANPHVLLRSTGTICHTLSPDSLLHRFDCAHSERRLNYFPRGYAEGDPFERRNPTLARE